MTSCEKTMTSHTSKHGAGQFNSDEIDLSKLVGILFDAKWLIVGVTFLFAVCGVAVALLSTPIYKADALIQIEQKSSGGLSSLVGEVGELFNQESTAAAEIEIIRSRMILGDTVEKFHLTTVVTPQYWPLVGKGIARLAGESNTLDVTRFELPAEAMLQSHTIRVLDSQHYQLLDQNDDVILSGMVGQLAEQQGYQLLVRGLHIEENGFEFNIAKQSKLDAIKWLKDNLSVAEKGNQTGIVELSFTGENPVLIQHILDHISQSYFLQNVKRNSAEAEKSLAFLKQHLPQIKGELDSSEDKLNNFRQENESIDLSLEAKATLDVMVKLEAQLNELTFKESEISQRFTQDHPAYKSLLDKRQTLLKEKRRLDAQVQKLPRTQREILRMRRDVEVNQQIYIQLLNKVQELSVIKAGTVGNVRILDDAQTYAQAIKPRKSLIAVLATLLGGMLSVAFVLIKAAMNRGVESPEEIEALGLSVYASIPKSEQQASLAVRARRKNKPQAQMALLAEENPADLSIEALRGLRTSLHFAMMEAKNNVLMISGPAPGIGKSFISTNFSAVAAKSGQKVLLIDADMRKGYLQQTFGLQSDNGLSDYLSGQMELGTAIKSTGVDNVDLISRGRIPPNPSELLMHKRFTELLEWASENYELVIVDTPPVLAVTDPSIVGALAGTTLMVARFGQNTTKEIDIARQRFEQSGIEVKGIIFNAIERKSSNAYEYYNYSYASDN